MTPLSLTESAPVGALHQADKQFLQGSWISVRGRRNVQFLVAGNHFTIKFNNHDIYMGTFELDATTRPRSMTMLIEQGPIEHCGKVSYCIYERGSEDTVRWCAAEPGVEEPLSGFPAADETNVLHVEFRRE